MPELYERLLRSLLWRVRARRLSLGVQRLLARVQARAQTEDEPATAFLSVYERTRAQVIRQLVRARIAPPRPAAGNDFTSRRAEHTTRLLEATIPPATPEMLATFANSPDFQCDAGLGGLARWLRAAGYDARFWPGISDPELIRVTQASAAILLTTDRRLMERAVVRWGAVPALLVPVAGDRHAQFRHTRCRLDLHPKPPRCMACGGDLQPVDKLSVRHRIPPRTFPWCDRYFVCSRCDRLFWEGTHWQRIAPRLQG